MLVSRLSSTTRICAVVAAVAAGLLTTLVAGTSAGATSIPHVNLSLPSAGAAHHRDGSWTISDHTTTANAVVTCTGTFLTPSIVASGSGTAVHYGVKWACNTPVSFDITVGVENEQPQSGGTLSVFGGSVHRTGVSQNPFADGTSTQCANNRNSGWAPFEFTTVGPINDHSDGPTTTVGCMLNAG